MNVELRAASAGTFTQRAFALVELLVVNEAVITRHGKMGGLVLTISGSAELVNYATWAALFASTVQSKL